VVLIGAKMMKILTFWQTKPLQEAFEFKRGIKFIE